MTTPRITPQGVTNGTVTQVTINADAPEFSMEGISISLRRKTLTVKSAHWRTSAEVTVQHPHLGILRMNLKVQSLYPVCRAPAIAPHGVLGQTFDCDGLAVDGNEDSYNKLPDDRATSSSRKLVTTRAQAEGGIEGMLTDYELRWPCTPHHP